MRVSKYIWYCTLHKNTHRHCSCELQQSQITRMSSSSGANVTLKDELHDLDPIDRIKIQLFADEADDDRTNK